ncbi:hypothetical protein AD954_09275 [Acetobacter cerevisiae]|uniref:SGNH hydrolase-type esterase domain-containing protein n=1 Tax=Acetobacter cerevisiae TaxID=178900 RepID=A0A149VAV7_9PROT|nr:hypothetical protein AD954_09275 [Acetobacter cerevisiae]
MILLHFLGNDIPEFSPSNVVSAIEFFQSFPKIPDIIIGITYRPSYSKDVMPGEEFLQYYTEKWQKAFQASVGWLRTYCQANGIAYIDFDRYVSVARDGYDPEDVALSTITPQVGTTLPAYEQWLSGTVNDVGWDWHFPAIQSPTGTTANACTDFSITQRFDTLPTMLIYTLDDEKIGINVSRPVAVYIWFNDASGKIVYAHSDGVRNPDANRIITNISVPKDVSANNPILCAFEAVGPRVRFRIFEPFKNNTSFAPGALDKFGTGETVVCDLLMGRPMAATTMRVSFIGPSSAQMAVLRLCVGNRSCNCRDVHRYVPTTPCYDLYSIIGNSTAPIGGSQAFHMNSSGIRDTQWRAVRDQEWHFLDPNPNKNPFIKTLTVSGVEGNSYIGKYPDGAPGIYRWFDTGGETIATDPGAHNAGQYVVAYKAGQMDANVGSGGFVTIRDASYSYRHFTPHTFKSSAYFAGNLLGVTVSGETNTTILNAATTAPSTPTDAGAEGEFRIDDAGIYFHRNGKWQRILFDPDWE